MKIIFPHKASVAISFEIMKYPEVETGGVLLGCYTNDNITVEAVIEGGPRALRERCNFQADKDYIDMNIDMIQANTDFIYLGEWHSHPQIEPYPSSQDLESLNEICESAGRPIIMTIFGFIDFSINKIDKQSIGIIKMHDRKKFYKIPIQFKSK